MITIMLLATAVAIVPALLSNRERRPVHFSHFEHDDHAPRGW